MTTYRRMLKDKDGNNLIPITYDSAVWDFTKTESTTQGDVRFSKTTTLGRTINFLQANCGTALVIENGGSGIRVVKHIVSFKSAGFSAILGVHGIASDSYIYARYTGDINGSSHSFREVKHQSDSGVTYGTAIELNSTVTGGVMDYKITRMGTDRTFVITGNCHFAGVNTSAFFTIEVTAKDANSIPSLYTRGSGSSINNVFHSIEILETIE